MATTRKKTKKKPAAGPKKPARKTAKKAATKANKKATQTKTTKKNPASAKKPASTKKSTKKATSSQGDRSTPLVTAESVREAHRLGLFVDVWTVNQPDEMRRLLTLQVDGLMSDFPARLGAVVRAHAAGR